MQATVNHFTTPDFWFCYRHLTVEVQELPKGGTSRSRRRPTMCNVAAAEWWASAQSGLSQST